MFSLPLAACISFVHLLSCPLHLPLLHSLFLYPFNQKGWRSHQKQQQNATRKALAIRLEVASRPTMERIEHMSGYCDVLTQSGGRTRHTKARKKKERKKERGFPIMKKRKQSFCPSVLCISVSSIMSVAGRDICFVYWACSYILYILPPYWAESMSNPSLCVMKGLSAHVGQRAAKL